jgi:hypothetical protein
MGWKSVSNMATKSPIRQSSPSTMLRLATIVAPVLMKTRSPSTREPVLEAPNSIGIVLQRKNKRPHVIDPAVRSTGHRPSTVTMADRAPAQRNTAVAQRLKGKSRTLSTDHIPTKSAKLAKVAAEPASPTPGVETIIEPVNC